MKIITVVGARPQFIKASMLSNSLKNDPDIEEVIVHTGQHYDENMSDIFINQLKMPKPDYNLGIGSGSHGMQTGNMLIKLEKVMNNVKPDLVLVYGDTNSTLAGSLAAAKLHVPLAHVEAGLRSFNKRMPEEINRKLTDHLADFFICPTKAAVDNLNKEGILKGVYLTGDIMYDALLNFKQHALQHSSILETLSLTQSNYYLLTIHRAKNTDDPERLKAILQAFQQLDKKVILPLHPRTKDRINKFGLNDMILSSPIQAVEPLGYFDMLAMASQATAIATDSGSMQKKPICCVFHV